MKIIFCCDLLLIELLLRLVLVKVVLFGWLCEMVFCVFLLVYGWVICIVK